MVKQNQNEPRVAMTFRVGPRSAKRFAADARRAGLSQSKFLEALIQRSSGEVADDLEALLKGTGKGK